MGTGQIHNIKGENNIRFSTNFLVLPVMNNGVHPKEEENEHKNNSVQNVQYGIENDNNIIPSDASESELLQVTPVTLSLRPENIIRGSIIHRSVLNG